jgi:hypothetical protein
MDVVDGGLPQGKPAGEVVGAQRMPVIKLPLNHQPVAAVEPGTEQDTTHRLGGCFALTLLGLRREEVGGLRWSDIELDTGALRICRARVDVNGRDTIVPTKTERCARGLPVPPRGDRTNRGRRARARRLRQGFRDARSAIRAAALGRRPVLVGSAERVGDVRRAVAGGPPRSLPATWSQLPRAPALRRFG